MWEGPVRKISNVAVAAIVAIALYFALAWGYDGLRILVPGVMGYMAHTSMPEAMMPRARAALPLTTICGSVIPADGMKT